MTKRVRYDDLLLLAPEERVQGEETCYVIERLVGTGAFAAVYAAHDPDKPGRQVALKEFFPARRPRDQAVLQTLFDRERVVGMQAGVHPLMPTFYEAFAADNRFYIAQEFIEGQTLSEIIPRRYPLSQEWILKWAVSLCDALAFLHSRQIVHHDLKPANIRIDPLGHLKLLDFGAAQYFGAGHEDEPVTEMYGTEGYLPPELEEDGEWVADVRTDIFALGCILYEMIAGSAPDQDMINQRSMYVTNALLQKPGADLNMVKLINTALSYNQDYRYASANHFLLELRKMAPPILLVDKKHLRFGSMTAHTPAEAMQVTLYNAGGGDLRGEIKPRTPWIVTDSLRFQGNVHQVTVRVDPKKIEPQGTLMTGRLEINSVEQRDTAGQLISNGDRWFIECSATVVPRPGLLAARERKTRDAPPILVTGRRGHPAFGTFELKNYGEETVEFDWDALGAANIQVSPRSGRLAMSESVQVTVTVTMENLSTIPAEMNVRFQTTSGQNLSIPLSVRTASPLDFLKSRKNKR